jgi:hypothetical protein
MHMTPDSRYPVGGGLWQWAGSPPGDPLASCKRLGPLVHHMSSSFRAPWLAWPLGSWLLMLRLPASACCAFWALLVMLPLPRPSQSRDLGSGGSWRPIQIQRTASQSQPASSPQRARLCGCGAACCVLCARCCCAIVLARLGGLRACARLCAPRCCWSGALLCAPRALLRPSFCLLSVCPLRLAAAPLFLIIIPRPPPSGGIAIV